MPNSRDLLVAIVVILVESFSTARSDSLLESSIKSASSINCRPWGNKATETIKIGDEVLKIPLRFVVILSPCSTAFEHTHIALSGLPEFEGQLISLSSLNPSVPPASLIRLDNDYLDRIDRSVLPSGHHELIKVPLPPGDQRTDLAYIGRGSDNKAITHFICQQWSVKNFAYVCDGNTMYRSIGVDYYIPYEQLHNWRSWDDKVRQYIASLLVDNR